MQQLTRATREAGAGRIARTEQHQHRAKISRIVGWSHCVTPTECAANPQRQIAHGNIIEIVT